MRRATLAAAVLLALAPPAQAKAPPGPAAVVRAWTAALTAFVVRNGKIVRWVQLPVPKSATAS